MQANLLLLKDLARKGNTPPGGKNHLENDGRTTIFSQHDEERSNMAMLEGHLRWNKAISHNVEKLWATFKTLKNIESQK